MRALGTGGFGQVLLANYSGRQVVVKLMPPLATSGRELRTTMQFKQEILLHLCVSRPCPPAIFLFSFSGGLTPVSGLFFFCRTFFVLSSLGCFAPLSLSLSLSLSLPCFVTIHCPFLFGALFLFSLKHAIAFVFFSPLLFHAPLS